MTITLSTDQSNALDQVVDWFTKLKTSVIHCNKQGDGCPPCPHTHGHGAGPVFSVGGKAGTGKTTLVKELEKVLGIQAAYGTPTHKAAAVLRSKLDRQQAYRVRTYHSLIYHMQPEHFCDVSGQRVRRIVDTCTCGQIDACECPARFDPCGGRLSKHECRVREELEPQRRKHLGGHRDLIVIDESSMLSPEQIDDVRYFGVPVIIVGDRGQLPPIKAPMNPYTMNPDVELTEIQRQAADSGILQAAHDVRDHGYLRRARYGNGDVVRYPLSHPEMRGVVERWTPTPGRLMVCYTNRLRAELNSAWHGEGPLRPGDRVVALGGRSYETPQVIPSIDGFTGVGNMLNVHNGMTGTVRWVELSRGGRLLDMIVELDDHILASSGHPVFLRVDQVARAQFGAERDLWKNSPERPRGSRLWDYAYALTAHKAQGSEFGQVIVMDEGITGGGIYPQWMYTSLTRAKEAVIVADYRR